jgi:hypothetical protein
MSNFLKDLALAHQAREGFFVPGQNPKFPLGTPSYRNNNPGNLRLTAYQQKAYGAVQGIAGFARFPSYEIGLQALMDDLRAKITGHSAHINYSRNPTFLTYVKVFAPKEDGNDPNGYCQFLCGRLAEYRLSPETPLSQLAALIQNENVPQPQDPALQLKMAEEAVGRVGGLRKFVLQRFIVRMRKLFGGVN